MSDFLERERLLVGDDGVRRLQTAHIAVFGVGGVGSYAVEALCRSGVGNITAVDNDSVSASNINRQLIALNSTIGVKKVLAARQRALDINPAINFTALDMFYDQSSSEKIDFSQFDYIIDAIDTVTSKLLIIKNAAASATPIISCMGAGNKLHPERLTISDISKTSVCPLARVMRYELRQLGIRHLQVVWSDEQPKCGGKSESGRPLPGSIAFVPSVAGLLAAGHVVRALLEMAEK